MQAKQFDIKEEIPAGLYNGNDCGAMWKKRSHFRNLCNLLLISGLRFYKSQTRAPGTHTYPEEAVGAFKSVMSIPHIYTAVWGYAPTYTAQKS